MNKVAAAELEKQQANQAKTDLENNLAEMSETLQQKEADLQHHIQQVSIFVYL
jgi:hypothetical protein